MKEEDRNKIINGIIDDVLYCVTNKYCSVGFDIETLDGPDYRLLDNNNFDSFLKEFLMLLKKELNRAFYNENNENQIKMDFVNVDEQKTKK
jgi:hypothetical protein